MHEPAPQFLGGDDSRGRHIQRGDALDVWLAFANLLRINQP